jgi:serralysin
MCIACAGSQLSYGVSSDAEAPVPNYGGSGSNFWASQTATSDTNTNGVLSGSKWGGTTLTYSFPTSTAQYESGYGDELNAFSAAGAGLQTATRYAMNLVSQYTNLVTTEVDPATTTADVRTANYSNATENPTAYAYYPSNSATGGDIWYGTEYPQYQTPVKGQYAWTTVIHELGHALGLKHGHQTGGVAGTAMQSAFDQMAYSVMTYRSYQGGPTTGYTNETNGYATTYMMYDIAALQAMYGANFNTNSGNTTYSWNASTGEMSINGTGQGAPGGNRIFMTVWDGNGIDTYDFSNYSTNLTVNLAPGAFSITSATQLSNLGGGNTAPGNIFNALQYNGDARSLIENANGGSGNDTITGNAADNILKGGAGTDTLNGGDGHDALFGGTGSDTLNGGNGWDTARYDEATSGIVAGLSGWVNYGEAAGDTFSGVEGIYATNFTDFLGGDGNSNALYGRGGNDALWGYNGNDYLYGGDDNDALFGGAGADLLDGGAGWDTARYDDATSGVIVGLSGWTNYGEAAGDTFVSIESLYATNFADSLGGDGNTNALYGRGGNDTLYGYGGNDYLYGGTGADTLSGGTGNDLFEWSLGDGNDFIADFEGGAGTGDVIRLLNSGFTSFAQLQGSITQTAGVNQSEIHLGSTTIYVWGILPGQFSANDFLFS